MLRKPVGTKTLILATAILGVNLAALGVLMYQIKAERKAFLTLRSEDGFLLMDTATHQMIHHMEITGNQPDPNRVRDLLDQISGHADVSYSMLHGPDGTLIQESPSGTYQSLLPMEQDMDIQEAIFSADPFTRVLDIGQSRVLECVWPFYVDNRYMGTMRVGLSLDFVDILNRNFARNVSITIALILLLNAAFVSAFVMNRRLTRDGLTFRMVLDAIGDGVLIQDDRGREIRNRAFEMLFPDGAPAELSQCGESTCHLRHGERTLLILRNRTTTMTMFIIRDITIQHLAEETQNREKRLFSMGKLSSVLAHEIRNPLNTISMIIQRMGNRTGLPEQETRMLSTIMTEIERMNQHVTDYIRLSRLPDVHIQPIGLRPLLEDMRLLYSARLEECAATLSIEQVSERVRIMGDPDQMRGVLGNLIENSLLADATAITFQTRQTDPYTVLTVSDNGHGMEQDIADRAFELYFTTREHGTGLGLAHVHRIMSAQNGMVEIQSSPGSGTEVLLYFPTQAEVAS